MYKTNYLLYFSGGLIITAFIAYFMFSENRLSHKAGLFAAGHGIFFGVGFICLAMGLTIYQVPVSKLVPLVNMSTLVTVIFGLIIFSEYTKLNVVYLLIGSALIVIGGILVGRA